MECGAFTLIDALTQTLKRWKSKVLPSRRRVPAGHVAVCVGSEWQCRRFILPVTHLNHPVLAKFLREAETQYGFDGKDGPILIPCEESEFEEALRVVTRSANQPPSGCRVATESESRPLLHGTLLC
uniref:Uncharacterized protein n=1 Tax=Opuntia streptacantha TaxID=393608 RepID=A0A7C9CY62_OPUST